MSVDGKRLRSMPITGVMPEPAVTKSSLPTSSGARTRRRPARGGAACRAWVVHEVVADQAVGHGLDRDRDQAVGARAVGERVGAPLAHTVDVDADADVLARHVAGPVGAGLDQSVAASGVSGWTETTAAQVGARAQGREEVEEVGGDQRRAGGLGQLGAGGRAGRAAGPERGRGGVEAHTPA